MNRGSRYLFLASFLLSAAFIACSSSHAQNDQAHNIPKPKDYIPPDVCRILGRIVSIDTTRQTTDTLSPCFKAPCRARVHVDSLYGCGMGFPSGLYEGEEITAFFMYTLGPTKETYPALKATLPGLQIGSRFEANVMGHPAPEGDQLGNSTIEFTVFDYTVVQ
ncbi:MAG TPA: hypothetical protein VFA55_09960 [Candidatus Kapabacteria bacterium]|nr:hypothetical protein [Candidatus Kapabacteria bacterium]